MKRVIVGLIVILLTVPLYAAAPTRTFTYTSGNTIEPDEVSTNEDSIFTYLQAGVDTLASNAIDSSGEITDGVITNADLAAAAKNSIEDADNDTKVQVEESGDEDLIRLDIAGTETVVFGGGATTDTIDVVSPITTAKSTEITANSITTGNIFKLISSSTDVNTRNLTEIVNNNAAADGARCLFLDQNADEPAALIDCTGDGGAHIRFVGDPANASDVDGDFWFDGTALQLSIDGNNQYVAISDGGTGGAGSAGAGNQYIEIEVNGTVYKVLHDGSP